MQIYINESIELIMREMPADLQIPFKDNVNSFDLSE
jgi:hypothetical protein